MVPLWAFAATGLWLAVGAFLMQIMVQRAWGVIPVHLNELSPDDARGTFPGFTYQLGSLIASVNAPLQAAIAAHYGNDYALALAAVADVIAVVIVILTAVGGEAKDVAFRRGLARARDQRRRRSSELAARPENRPHWSPRPRAKQPAIPLTPFKTLNFSAADGQPRASAVARFLTVCRPHSVRKRVLTWRS